jgi:hypothetical protein
MFSVDEDLRFDPRASVHAVLMELSFPHKTTNLIGSGGAASGRLHPWGVWLDTYGVHRTRVDTSVTRIGK